MLLPASDYRGLRVLFLVSAIYLALMLAWGHHAHWGLRDGERAAVLLIVFSNLSAALGYFLVTNDAPLVDATLSRWDIALGFDWVAYCRWQQLHPWADLTLKYAYKSFIIQFPLMVIYLSLTRRFRQLSDFCGGMVVSMIITHVCNWFWPAAGAGKYYVAQLAVDMSGLSDFEPLRSGALRTIEPTALQGPISIPSYHTVLAVLFTCAFRRAEGGGVDLPLAQAYICLRGKPALYIEIADWRVISPGCGNRRTKNEDL